MKASFKCTVEETRIRKEHKHMKIKILILCMTNIKYYVISFARDIPSPVTKTNTQKLIDNKKGFFSVKLC